MRFVRINGVIYDYYEYRLKVLNLIRATIDAIDEAILKYGFIKENDHLFYNKKYDLELKIVIKNRKKMEFV